MKRKYGLIIGLWWLILALPGAIEILDYNNVTLFLFLDYTQELAYTLELSPVIAGTAEWQAPAAEIEIEADNEQFNLALSLDLSEIYSEEYQEIIGDCVFSFIPGKNWKFKVGQFKNPFGRENNKGKKSRAYPGHSVSSDEIAPGYSRGAALSAKKWLDLIDFTGGVFLSGKTTKNSNNLLKLLPAGNLVLKFPAGDQLEMEFAYSGFVDLDFTSLLAYELAQGLAVQFDFNLGSKNDISLFAEFLEKYSNAVVLNGNPSWTYGFFASASWRMAAFEPFVTYDHYLADTSAPTTDDTMVICGGINWYPADSLLLRLNYRWDYLYLTAANRHQAVLTFNYRM